MNKSILEELYKPFELKEREGLGNLKFKYIPSDDVIDRMNRVFNGCWSTEIINQETIDDFIVVRVRVSIYDEKNHMMYEHDGYGSSQIARFKSGVKAGKIIDIGNAYKSAMSKAIKYACTRWGVGLYLEKDMYGDDVQDTTQVTTEPTIPTSCVTKAESPNGPNNMVPPTSPIPPPPKDINSNPPQPVEQNQVPNENNDKVVPFPTAKFTVPNTAPDNVITDNTKADNVTIPYSAKPNKVDSITDVQKAALQGLLSLKDLKYNQLTQDALGRADNIPNPEDLSYKEAVIIIKYGNEMFRKNK